MSSVTILAIGDHGRVCEQFKRVTTAMNKINNKLVCLLGDNFYEDGVKSVNDPKWKSVFLEHFSPNKMYLPVLGNHDYLTNPKSQIQFNQGGWTCPSRFFRTEINSTLVGILFIDTVLLCPITSFILGVPEQKPPKSPDYYWGWIEKELANMQNMKWRIVIGHYPVYSDGSHGDTNELKDRLAPLLRKYKVHMYLSAHEHNFQHKIVDDVHYLICGTGAKKDFFKRPNSSNNLFFTAMGGFLMMSIDIETIRLSFIDEFERPLYSFQII